MRDVTVCVEDVENRDKWRFRTKVAYPKLLGGRRMRRKRRLLVDSKSKFSFLILKRVYIFVHTLRVYIMYNLATTWPNCAP